MLKKDKYTYLQKYNIHTTKERSIRYENKRKIYSKSKLVKINVII